MCVEDGGKRVEGPVLSQQALVPGGLLGVHGRQHVAHHRGALHQHLAEVLRRGRLVRVIIVIVNYCCNFQKIRINHSGTPYFISQLCFHSFLFPIFSSEKIYFAIILR